MYRASVGVIGHVDHGKTALVRALTGQDTDRLPEEKSRGISIALGFAYLTVDADTEIDLIDMPGHENFVRTMISGATGIDAVLLVVAANEGIKPQTVEHIDIAGLLGIRRAVVAISKSDLVDTNQANRVAKEVTQLLIKSGLETVRSVMTSALQGQGIAELSAVLRLLAANLTPRAEDGLLFLPIDRAFSVAGHGSVVTGTLRGAGVKTDDTLELLPLRRSVRIRGLQVHGKAVEAAVPGQRVALNLRDVEVAELERGMSLAVPESLVLADWLTAAIRVVDNAPTLKNGMRLRAMLGTAEFDVRLRLLACDELLAGQSAFAQLHCVVPIAVPAREHVILRIASPPRTVAGGPILESVTRRWRRHSLPTLQRLEDLRTLSMTEMIAAEVRRVGIAGTTPRHLSLLAALTVSRVVEILKTLPTVVTPTLVVWRADMDGLLARIPTLLASHAIGLSQDKILSVLSGTGTAVLSEALRQLLTQGVLSQRGGQFLIPRPDEERAHARSEVELAATICDLLQRNGLTPPNPGEIVTSPQSKRAIDRLLRDRVIVRAVDRSKGKELLFHRDAIEAARRKLSPLLKPPGLLVTEIGAALGVSRKFVMPLLDHLDTIRFTRRIGDRRILA